MVGYANAGMLIPKSPHRGIGSPMLVEQQCPAIDADQALIKHPTFQPGQCVCVLTISRSTFFIPEEVHRLAGSYIFQTMVHVTYGQLDPFRI